MFTGTLRCFVPSNLDLNGDRLRGHSQLYQPQVVTGNVFQRGVSTNISGSDFVFHNQYYV